MFCDLTVDSKEKIEDLESERNWNLEIFKRKFRAAYKLIDNEPGELGYENT